MSGQLHYDIRIHVYCVSDNNQELLDTEFTLDGQTLAQVLQQAQVQLANLLNQLMQLDPNCSLFTAEVLDPDAGIDYSVGSASLLTLVAQIYTELVFILLSL